MTRGCSRADCRRGARRAIQWSSTRPPDDRLAAWLRDPDEVPFAVLKPCSPGIANVGDPVRRLEPWAVVFLEGETAGPKLLDHRRQILDDQRHLRVGAGSLAAAPEEPEPRAVGEAVAQTDPFLASRGQPEFFRIEGPRPRQILGRDRRLGHRPL